MLAAFSIYFASSAAYDVLRSNNLLSLPCPLMLKQIKSSINVSPTEKSRNISYLTAISKNLTELEKIVILQLDEIYINSSIMYSGGQLIGFAENSENLCESRTIQAFLISSLFGNMKNICNLVPVKNLNGIDLFKMTMTTLDSISKAGMKVIGIVADNNKVNVNNDEPIFLVFDSVHILKNW